MKHINIRFVVLLLFMTGFSVWAGAQRTITGTVVDATSNEALIGASVVIKGTSTGTVTDLDGKYSIQVDQSPAVLVFSYVGFSNREIDLGGSNILNVKMSAGELLGEVVVVGYGTVKKEDVTGAVQVVSTEEFNKGSITSAQELISGKMAGVQITTAGDPGGGSKIVIRGGSSLSASNDPLIVIDGIPIDNGSISGGRNPLNLVNPADIESITVLKDASATAIYGSRASNGVLIITTKKGKTESKLRIDYSGNVSIGNIAKKVDVFTADEYRTVINEQFEEGHPARDLVGTESTDWQDEIYQTAIGTDHSLSFSGGVKALPYRLSLGFTDKSGVLKRDKFNRTTVGLNVSPGFLDNTLQVNLNVKGMAIRNQFGNRDAIGSAARFDPTKPVLDGDSPFGGYYTWTQPNGNPNVLAPANPLALIDLKDDQSDVNRFIINGSVDYRLPFLTDLRANLSMGYDQSIGQGSVSIPTNASFSFDPVNGGGTENEYKQTKKNSLLDFYLNYTKKLGSTKLDLTGGYSWQHFELEDFYSNSNANGSIVESRTTPSELFLVSFFGRLNYTIQDKYLFTFTLRRDGSSRFSPENRWGLFPAAAFAWKILDDPTADAVSTLKLRAGYGVTGQQDIGGYYVYLPRYLSSFENAQYQFGDQFVTTLRPEGYDFNIKWEETKTINIGFDYGIMQDRITGSIEYYQRNTEDLLNFIPVPAGSNLTNFINTNVGDLTNQGVEFSVFADVFKDKPYEWEVGFNMSANTNEITKLTATDDPNYIGVATGGISGGVGNTVQIHSVGFPASSFFVYEQVYNEDGLPIEGLYVDRNGDGVISDADKYHLDKPAPDMFFGLTSGFNYGNFDFSFAGRASLGNYIYNNIQSDFATYGRLFNSTDFIENAHADAVLTNFNNPQYLTDHYIQEGSFFRMDHITVGYSLGDKVSQLSSLRVYATAQNPFIVTNYSGIDPELEDGLDKSIYPRSRTFVFGVTAGF